MGLRVLILSQYFWPENMRINDLSEELSNRGYHVTVLTGVPNYPEGHVYPEYVSNPARFNKYNGSVDIIRVPMLTRGNGRLRLALNYLSFLISASTFGVWKLRRKSIDLVFFYGISPITSAIPGVFIARLKNAKLFLWILDLWPETIEALGILKKGILLRVLTGAIKWIYDHTDCILINSRAFEESVRSVCAGNPANIRYFPSWAESVFDGELISSSRSSTTFDIVFAGNIGESQDFMTLIRGFELLKNDKSIKFRIAGDGRFLSQVRTELAARGLDNVELLGRLPLEQMPTLFSQADALLLSLKADDVFSRAVPAKLFAYLAAGKPILAVIGGESARIIYEAGAGFACDSGDYRQFVKNVVKLKQMDASARSLLGAKGRAHYLDHFRKDRIFDQLEKLLEQPRFIRN